MGFNGVMPGDVKAGGSGRPMRFGSLFAGIGGFDLGLERAGMECAWQVEIDPFCREVLEKHWPGVPKYGDIRDLSGEELEAVDLICGGFPCQDLSLAGKRAGINGPQSGLWAEFARLIGELRPRWVVVENVPGVLVPKKEKGVAVEAAGIARVVGALARLGYVGVWFCLRASDFGASHHRKRVFVVACRAEGGRSDRGGEDVADADCGQRQQRWGAEQDAGYGAGWLSRSDGSGEPVERVGKYTCGSCGGTYDAYEYINRVRMPSTGEHVLAPRECPWCGGRAGSITYDRKHGGAGDPSGPNRPPGDVDYPERPRLEVGDRKRGEPLREIAEPFAAGLPAFALGPSDPRWPDILRERPDLAPSLEPPLRGMADGVPVWLDRAMSDRTKRLKAIGNAVVPDCVEYLGILIIAVDAVVAGKARAPKREVGG